MYESHKHDTVLSQSNGARKRKITLSEADEPSGKRFMHDRLETLRRGGRNKRSRGSTGSSYERRDRSRSNKRWVSGAGSDFNMEHSIA